MSGAEDKSDSMCCGTREYESEVVMLPIIDENTGRVIKEVQFLEYKCKLCGKVWRERWS